MKLVAIVSGAHKPSCPCGDCIWTTLEEVSAASATSKSLLTYLNAPEPSLSKTEPGDVFFEIPNCPNKSSSVQHSAKSQEKPDTSRYGRFLRHATRAMVDSAPHTTVNSDHHYVSVATQTDSMVFNTPPKKVTDTVHNDDLELVCGLHDDSSSPVSTRFDEHLGKLEKSLDGIEHILLHPNSTHQFMESITTIEREHNVEEAVKPSKNRFETAVASVNEDSRQITKSGGDTLSGAQTVNATEMWMSPNASLADDTFAEYLLIAATCFICPLVLVAGYVQ